MNDSRDADCTMYFLLDEGTNTPDALREICQPVDDAKRLSPPLHPSTTASTIMTSTIARMTSKQHAFPLAFF